MLVSLSSKADAKLLKALQFLVSWYENPKKVRDGIVKCHDMLGRLYEELPLRKKYSVPKILSLLRKLDPASEIFRPYEKEITTFNDSPVTCYVLKHL